MSPEERDLAYIWDMLEYANKVVLYRTLLQVILK